MQSFLLRFCPVGQSDNNPVREPSIVNARSATGQRASGVPLLRVLRPRNLLLTVPGKSVLRSTD